MVVSQIGYGASGRSHGEIPARRAAATAAGTGAKLLQVLDAGTVPSQLPAYLNGGLKT